MMKIWITDGMNRYDPCAIVGVSHDSRGYTVRFDDGKQYRVPEVLAQQLLALFAASGRWRMQSDQGEE